MTGQDVAETSESLQFHEVQPAGIGIRHMHRKVAPARPDCTFPQVVRSGQSNESVRLSGEICVIDLLSAAVVAGDYNNDGYVDLYFTVHSGPSRLYRNKGEVVLLLLLSPKGYVVSCRFHSPLIVCLDVCL